MTLSLVPVPKDDYSKGYQDGYRYATEIHMKADMQRQAAELSLLREEALNPCGHPEGYTDLKGCLKCRVEEYTDLLDLAATLMLHVKNVQPGAFLRFGLAKKIIVNVAKERR